MSESTQTDQTSAAAEDLVAVTIDGREIKVPKGTNVLEAARKLGINISAFCYHPGLSIAACCRQCLVSVENAPKLQPSCQMACSDGMVVKTEDDASTLARKQMLEFTLVNHPIDCPICDKAGECTLQSLYFDHDNAKSRVDVAKVRKPKVVDIGPHIVLDAERCILCTRCIRVCDEVAGQHQLEWVQRGDHKVLSTAPGERLDNPYSINTVDVCPVGALTAKDFRFTLRSWELMMTPSVCTGCSRGCNVEVHHQNGRVWRTVPRHNEEVNQHWMCDEGRFIYHDLRKDRLATPTVDGLPAHWDSAVERAAELLKPYLDGAGDGGRDSIAVVISASETNETAYVAAKLARDIWQLSNIYIAAKPSVPERADKILRTADVDANSAGLKAIAGDAAKDIAAFEQALASGSIRAVLVIGNELAVSEDSLTKIRELGASIAIADRELALASAATVALPATAWAETDGTITNAQEFVQRLNAAIPGPGTAKPAWQALTLLARACNAALNYETVDSIFAEMTSKVELFKDASWQQPVAPIQLRWANSRG